MTLPTTILARCATRLPSSSVQTLRVRLSLLPLVLLAAVLLPALARADATSDTRGSAPADQSLSAVDRLIDSQLELLGRPEP
jgi:hypothetical protein